PRRPALRRSRSEHRDIAGRRRARGPDHARVGGGRRRARFLLPGGGRPRRAADLRPLADLLAAPRPAAAGAPERVPPVARSRGGGHLLRGELPVTAPPAPAPSTWTLPRLRIDRDGAWFHDDAEVTHAGVLANLRENLQVDERGHYLQIGPARVPVEVEDTPFVVERVEVEGEGLTATL